VGVGQSLAHLLKNAQEARQVVGGRGPLLQQVGEGAALDELHGQERPAVGEGADLVDGRDAGVLQLPRDLRLLPEAPLVVRVAPELLAQHLDGQGPAQVGVPGTPHGAHAAPGNLRLDQVAPRPGG
jgi:hypothetical protein